LCSGSRVTKLKALGFFDLRIAYRSVV